jgi:3-deoxy-D-manno-octulosonic-acid transferase
MYTAYTLVLTLALLAWSPALLLEALGRRHRRLESQERLGHYPEELRFDIRSTQPIWLHAVSVGEVGAASILASALAARWPQLSLLVSTVTATGREVARRSFPKAAGVVYYPIDLPLTVRRALNAIRPRLVVLTETEIWPNFLRGCAASNIPVVLVNGRISRRSFGRYRLVRPLFRQVLHDIDLFCMQSRLDAERILALGAPSERVHVVGNLKFDASPALASSLLGDRWRRELAIEARRPVLVAGSTHPGEEEIVLQAVVRLRREFPDLLLVLAPRHPDRLDSVEAMIVAHGLAPVRRTALTRTPDRGGNVVLLDTVGELSSLYAAGTVAFVGGSLVPRGGHNLLEPAMHGCAILMGPHMGNFAEASTLFLRHHAAVQVGDVEELVLQLGRLLRDAPRREQLGRAALQVLAAHRGACERTVALLDRFLS